MRSLKFATFGVMLLALIAMVPDTPTSDGVMSWAPVIGETGPAPPGLEAQAPIQGLTFEMSLYDAATREPVQPITAESQEPMVALLSYGQGDSPATMLGRYKPLTK